MGTEVVPKQKLLRLWQRKGKPRIVIHKSDRNLGARNMDALLVENTCVARRAEATTRPTTLGFGEHVGELPTFPPEAPTAAKQYLLPQKERYYI
jgi:hypothetical protein